MWWPTRASTLLAALLLLSTAPACRARQEAPGPGPEAPAYSEELMARLLSAMSHRDAGFDPRTEHRLTDGRPRYVNRLVLEASPYLQQHAHNPVDWYPWGPEAFARARRENRPIFLSIGYSTCHWCHVMERESFDDLEIARRLNRSFICIKVDRERRPHVDDLYMTAVRLTTGRGGWPMSSFLTPDGSPFFGGTYYPPEQFAELLDRVAALWQTRRREIELDAQRIATLVSEVTSARGAAVEIGDSATSAAIESILGRYDRLNGGFGRAPKFPQESHLLLLLHALQTEPARPAADDRPSLLEVVETTLRRMARGGIYDQVGGGFHRYSTDASWLVPHFEKMLYNQALLTRAYLAAHGVTGEPLFSRVVRQTLDYVSREMTSPDGGFYSATDADSEGEEGAFFVWTLEELRQALTEPQAELAIRLFGATAEGNFEGRNILHLAHPTGELARRLRITPGRLLEELDVIRHELLQHRSTRPPPLRDEKLITAWNGMMITALAEAAALLDEPRYAAAARRAAELQWSSIRSPAGDRPLGLWRVRLEGTSSIEGLQEDYAYLAEGFVELFDLTGDAVWLERSRQLVDAMSSRFWDREAGGFFMSEPDPEVPLISRPKSPADGAIPSGNAVAVRALGLLAARTGHLEYRDRALQAVASFGASIERSPDSFSYLLRGADEIAGGEAGPLEYAASGRVVVRGRRRAEDGTERVTVELDIAEGWHVNAHQPLQELLIGTEVSSADEEDWRFADAAYPEPERIRLSFEDEPLALYRGRISIDGRLERAGDRARAGRQVRLRVRLQACDDRACLRPESLQLEIPPPDPGGRL